MPSPPGLPLHSLPTGEASSSLPGPGGMGPCPAAPRTGFFCRIQPAAAPRIKCLWRESHAVTSGVAAMPVEPVRNLLPFTPSLGM